MARHRDEQQLMVKQYEQQKCKILSKRFFWIVKCCLISPETSYLRAQQNPLRVIPPESKDPLSAVKTTGLAGTAGRQGEKDPSASSLSSYSHTPYKRSWIEQRQWLQAGPAGPVRATCASGKCPFGLRVDIQTRSAKTSWKSLWGKNLQVCTSFKTRCTAFTVTGRGMGKMQFSSFKTDSDNQLVKVRL